MASRIPQRLRWAVGVLDVQPDEQILEIGCGRGIAIELICARLDTGRVTGVDRSPVAIAAAQVRNHLHVASGRARLLHTLFADTNFVRSLIKYLR
jgi:cyclopropane fatty-acyl-phospholipid synthase-like methyltransferase